MAPKARRYQQGALRRVANPGVRIFKQFLQQVRWNNAVNATTAGRHGKILYVGGKVTVAEIPDEKYRALLQLLKQPEVVPPKVIEFTSPVTNRCAALRLKG